LTLCLCCPNSGTQFNPRPSCASNQVRGKIHSELAGSKSCEETHRWMKGVTMPQLDRWSAPCTNPSPLNFPKCRRSIIKRWLALQNNSLHETFYHSCFILVRGSRYRNIIPFFSGTHFVSSETNKQGPK